MPPSAWTLGRTHASRARCARSSRDPPGWPDRGHVAASGPAPQPCDWASSHTFPNHVGLPSAPAPPLACLRGQGQAGRPPLRRARRWLLRAVAVGAGTHLALLHECGSGRARARGCSPQKLSHRHGNLTFTCCETFFGFFFFNIKFLITNSNLCLLAVQGPEGLAAPLETGWPRPAAGHKEGHRVATQPRIQPL